MEQAKIQTKEQEAQFTKGISLLFQTWTAIELILENESAGEETDVMIEELEENLCNWLLRDGDELAISEIEDYINEVFSEDMNVDVQDGSVREISEILLSFYKECALNDFKRIQEWESILQKPKLKKSEMLSLDSSDEEQEEDHCGNNLDRHHNTDGSEHHHPHAPPVHHQQNQVNTSTAQQRDAEGWVTVQNINSSHNNTTNTTSRNRRNQNKLESAQKYLLDEDEDEDMH